MDELAALVRLMRDRQKRYFRTRSFETLREAAELEKKVDAALARLAEGPTLFQPEEGPR